MNLRREGGKNEILGSGPCHLRELRNLSFVSIQSASAQRLFTAPPHLLAEPSIYRYAADTGLVEALLAPTTCPYHQAGPA